MFVFIYTLSSCVHISQCLCLWWLYYLWPCQLQSLCVPICQCLSLSIRVLSGLNLVYFNTISLYISVNVCVCLPVSYQGLNLVYFNTSFDCTYLSMFVSMSTRTSYLMGEMRRQRRWGNLQRSMADWSACLVLITTVLIYSKLKTKCLWGYLIVWASVCRKLALFKKSCLRISKCTHFNLQAETT